MRNHGFFIGYKSQVLTMQDANVWLMAIALAFIIEGIIPILFPNKWRNYVLKIANESPATIRKIGMSIFAIGILLLWFSKA